jgi:K+-transporting ATPase ATPase C chain
MLTASASGLDPDLAPPTQLWQVERVACSRGVPAVEIRILLDKCITRRSLGIFGKPRVNPRL